MLAKTLTAHSGKSVPAIESAALDSEKLLTRRELAKRLGLSPRSISNLQARKQIPFVRLSARCVRFDVVRVLRALSKFEIREVGR